MTAAQDAARLAAQLRAEHPRTAGMNCLVCTTVWPCRARKAADTIDTLAHLLDGARWELKSAMTGACDLGPCSLAAGHSGRCFQ